MSERQSARDIPAMKPPTRIQRIPWRTIGLVLVAAALVAWTIGFVIGLIVRLGFGI